MKFSIYFFQILLLLAFVGNTSFASDSINSLDDDGFSSSEDEFDETDFQAFELHSFAMYQTIVEKIKSLKIIKSDLREFYKLAAAHSEYNNNIVELADIEQRICQKLNSPSVDHEIIGSYDLLIARKKLQEDLESVTIWVENNS